MISTGKNVGIYQSLNLWILMYWARIPFKCSNCL